MCVSCTSLFVGMETLNIDIKRIFMILRIFDNTSGESRRPGSFRTAVKNVWCYPDFSAKFFTAIVSQILFVLVIFSLP